LKGAERYGIITIDGLNFIEESFIKGEEKI